MGGKLRVIDDDWFRAINEMWRWYQRIGRKLELPGAGGPPNTPAVPVQLGNAVGDIEGSTGTSTGGQAYPVHINAAGAESVSTSTARDKTHRVYPAGHRGAIAGERLLLFRHQQSGRMLFHGLGAAAIISARVKVESTNTGASAISTGIVSSTEPYITLASTANITVVWPPGTTVYPSSSTGASTGPPHRVLNFLGHPTEHNARILALYDYGSGNWLGVPAMRWYECTAATGTTATTSGSTST
jgi:hypothetical protein